MDLRKSEEQAKAQIGQLMFECVRHGVITFDQLRYLFSDIAELTRCGISGAMIGEQIRNMVSPPIDSSELLARFKENRDGQEST